MLLRDKMALRAGGIVRGEITVDGYPKDQATLNRVSGYVEQVISGFCSEMFPVLWCITR